MSYEPTEWVRGTKITATKLNNIEMGVQSVNSEYTPTTWAEGDIVTAMKLNNIEQGIANASGGGSDFSTAEVTYIGEQVLTIPTLLINDEYGLEGSFGSTQNINSPYTVILYKGKAYLMEDVRVVSGNAEKDNDIGLTIITGDCVLEDDVIN